MEVGICPHASLFMPAAKQLICLFNLLNYTMTSAQKSLTLSKKAPGDINTMSGGGGSSD
jgi:hypothetical protein